MIYLMVLTLPLDFSLMIHRYMEQSVVMHLIFRMTHIRLEAWQQKWKMELNTSKSKIMCFTTKRDPPKREYVFCGEIPEEVDPHP